MNRLLNVIGVVCYTLLLSGCQNDDSVFTAATYPNNPDVFLDSFSGGLNYAAFSGTVPTAFQVDKKVTYNNTAQSMRFDVPNAGDRLGTYAGGAFFTQVGRDLTQYDALTFWVKATEAATIGAIGFGVDLGENKFQAGFSDLKVGTTWQKVIIPIPNPAALKSEKGLFYVSAGNQSGNGYSFWIDEVQFEKLGTIAHPQPSILNGENQNKSGFVGINANISNLQVLFNMPWGENQGVNVTPNYFTFISSKPEVASVDAKGIATIVGQGTATITAKLGDVTAKGSLTLTGTGVFVSAPSPTRAANRVISVFSDAYTNVPVGYYNGYWAPFQTTQSADFKINNDNVLNYTAFNFVGIEFANPVINASSMTHFHTDIFIPGTLATGATFKIQLVDFGADGAFGGNNDKSHTITYTAPTLGGNRWISIDIPFSVMTGLTSRTSLAQIVFEGTNISNFYADNIYFYN
ncbi:MAG: hypothetical protein JNN12_05085 [Bacteroidetes Order II. Incertae sedis bacterium]|nr:hypothetical protein [Bacteroidetes Order II. bacterium]